MSSAPNLNFSHLSGQNLQLMGISGPYSLRRGGVLPAVEIAYETWGTLNPQRDNAILLFTGLSPGAHAASSPADPNPGWWEYMVGPGKPIDSQRYYIICVNSLGSCFGSTGPASINPETGKTYGAGFPEITIEDIAGTAHALLDNLGISRAHVVGASLGGMAALAYAILYREAVISLVSISAAAAANAFAIGVRSVQRDMILHDPAWQGGDYSPDAGPAMGMLLARKLGLLSYRATSEWDGRFGRATLDSGAESPWGKFGAEFQIQSYLDYNARKFIRQFDANSYLYLSRAMDLFNAAEHGASLTEALRAIAAQRVLIIGVDSDVLFPVSQQQELARQLTDAGKQVRLQVIHSRHGHDAFLADREQFSPVIAEFFSS